MSNFIFLKEEQIFGKNKLDIFEKYGTKCAITDFAILLGGYVATGFYTNEGSSRKDRTGWWWTQTPEDNNARVVFYDCSRFWINITKRIGGARPALPYSAISSISSNVVRGKSGVKETIYGEYPQTIVDENFSNELEKSYNNGGLKVTGRVYTTDSASLSDYNKDFQPRTFTEYEYKGQKYIRFIGDSNGDGEVLPDGRTIQSGNVYWVKVEPITWLVDQNNSIALSKKILFSGVQFNKEQNYTGDFLRTNIKKFMDNFFAKEIETNNVYTNDLQEDTESLSGKKIRKKNPYAFNFANVEEEEIIKGALESNVAVFLHGRSSEGKSARVKQFDPDCEILYMRNATPDSLNGKSVYNAETKEMFDIPPTWYKRLVEKCSKEPDKIHILFFDELTNALPSIQGMAFNIILDGEVNGIWKLPQNARIVAAGNDLKDSLAANQMAEPLFNRFAHVYIYTTIDSWLRWASTPKEKYERLTLKKEEPQAKIHPAIYAYVAYKSYSGEDVLRTPYTGDKPNADPRKWEMASKFLYATNQPAMLRALIGNELTTDFIAFVRQQVITVEDVIEGNYTNDDFEMDIAQKFATAVGLSSVDDEHFEVVREFMKKIGAEPKAAFESMWTHGDKERLERLAELQLADSLSQGGIRK